MLDHPANANRSPEAQVAIDEFARVVDALESGRYSEAIEPKRTLERLGYRLLYFPRPRVEGLR